MDKINSFGNFPKLLFSVNVAPNAHILVSVPRWLRVDLQPGYKETFAFVVEATIQIKPPVLVGPGWPSTS